jgi:hypothetical protein
MEIFIVLQVLWEMFLVFMFAVGLTVICAKIAPFFFTEKQIETFLNKHSS